MATENRPTHFRINDFQGKFIPNPPQWHVTREVAKKQTGSHLFKANDKPKLVTVGYYLTLDRALLKIRDILVGEAGVEDFGDLWREITEISEMMVRNLEITG